MDSHYRWAVTELTYTRILRSHEACKKSPLVDACHEQKKEKLKKWKRLQIEKRKKKEQEKKKKQSRL